LYFVLFGISVLKLNAQLGFCSGNSGNPIFVEDFGTAPTSATQHVQLPVPGATTYMFLGSPPVEFADGRYTVSNMNYQQWNWFNEEDHTSGDINGRMLVVNASFVPGEFYRLPVSGLCENTTYTFSSWVKNLTPRDLTHSGGFPNPCNVRFEIWDSTNTTLLKSGNTGDFLGSLNAENGEWIQFGLLFKTQPGQNSIILKMVNNGVGGYGNDLAIDDIEFKSCGDSIEIEDTIARNTVNLCSTQIPYTTSITAIPDNVVFSSHFYQWQISTDRTIWIDIVGETTSSLTITGLIATTYYRTKVAESAINVNNGLCNTISDVFDINITKAPASPSIECWEITTFSDATCSWSTTGTQPAQPTLECWETVTFNNTRCSWEITGIQLSQPTLECYETATFNNTTCIWDVTGTQPVQPILECWETTTFNVTTCTWDISGIQPTKPFLECWEKATLNNTTCAWEVTGTQIPQPTLECYQTANFNNATCDWEFIGTQPTQPLLECWENATFNNTTCTWQVIGTRPAQPILECWESTTFNNTTCTWDISGTQPGREFTEDVVICSNDNQILQANTNIPNPIYEWNTGAMDASILTNLSGTFSVEISSSTTCDFETRKFIVTKVESPIIESIKSDGNTIIINTLNTGNFEYSLDGMIFQSNNTFTNVQGGAYNILVKEKNCPDVITTKHIHFYIPRFFTPNGDLVNDTFNLNGIELYNNSQVSIFDRYGKLLKNSMNSPFSWNGTFNNQLLPTGDYWYIIVIDNQKFTGHFTLKR